jgi:hypothetical protein
VSDTFAPALKEGVTLAMPFAPSGRGIDMPRFSSPERGSPDWVVIGLAEATGWAIVIAAFCAVMAVLSVIEVAL